MYKSNKPIQKLLSNELARVELEFRSFTDGVEMLQSHRKHAELQRSQYPATTKKGKEIKAQLLQSIDNI